MSTFCPSCGRSWEDIRRLARLGCPTCWDVFRDELALVVQDIQGATRHPDAPALVDQTSTARRQELEERLRQALAREDYAAAGQLRDRLREEKPS